MSVRALVNALILMSIVYVLTGWLGLHSHSLCDPLNALPWLRCQHTTR